MLLFLSHMVPIKRAPIDDDEALRLHCEARNLCNRYKKEAKLVITSRLHCAVPCMAMGIPVVLARDNISYTFSWVEKFLPIYGIEQYDSIDWNPESVSFEKEKEEIKKVMVNAILRNFSGKDDYQWLSDFFMDRKRAEYNLEFAKLIRQLREEKKECKLSAQSGLLILKVFQSFIELEKAFDNPEITFIDDFKHSSFQNRRVIRSHQIRSLDNNTIFFISSHVVKDAAVSLLRDMGREFFVL